MITYTQDMCSAYLVTEDSGSDNSITTVITHLQYLCVSLCLHLLQLPIHVPPVEILMELWLLATRLAARRGLGGWAWWLGGASTTDLYGRWELAAGGGAGG